MGQVSKTYFTKGVIAILLVIIALLGRANIGQQHQLARYEEREKARQLDDELAGLRVPYEALIYERKQWQVIRQARFDTCQEYGIEAVASYGAVLEDGKNMSPVPHEGACANASFECYWWNRFSSTCRRILSNLEEKRGTVYEAVVNQDPKTLACLRLHLGRAMKSRLESTTLSTCRLWLRLFEPTAELKESLARVVARPKGTQVTPEGTYVNYDLYDVQAVLIIDEYSLDIPYPEDIKASREYRRRMNITEPKSDIDANDSQTSN